MKKGIIGLVLVGMLGWAVYDLVAQDDTSQVQDSLVGNDTDEQQHGNHEENNGGSAADFEVEEETGGTGNENGTEVDDELGSGFADDTLPEGAEGEIGLEQGNRAPDFELETLAGETVKLSDYRGQKVMLNFWATWCPPCRAEMPDMQSFYKDDEVEILAVNLTQTEDRVANVDQFVADFELTFPILMDEEIEVADLYQIQPIPTSYLLDEEGYIHQVAFGPMNYEMMVQQFSAMDQ